MWQGERQGGWHKGGRQLEWQGEREQGTGREGGWQGNGREGGREAGLVAAEFEAGGR